MTKEKLMEWGLTEEQANKVMEGLNGSFVTKARFNEVNTELSAAKKTIGERDAQLETLKKASGDTQALQDQITQLQADNKKKDEDHANELKALKIGNAVELALTGAKAKNNTAVRALLADYLKDAKIEDGKVVAKVNNESITLAAKIEAMKKDANTDFLFGSTGAKLTGWKPGDPDTGRKPGEGKKPSEMSYSELAAFLAENPDAKLE